MQEEKVKTDEGKTSLDALQKDLEKYCKLFISIANILQSSSTTNPGTISLFDGELNLILLLY